ncbi:MAG: hypothetical protein HC897_19205 [Thermoanaerobaculia bacterium]|nr:hypothetical protein [Thermoanaerobaculia bacterium]
MAVPSALEKLLSPKTIAVLGASRTPGKLGHELLANLLRGGFEGRDRPDQPPTPPKSSVYPVTAICARPGARSTSG